MTTLKTVDDIRVAIDALELDVAASYFDNDDDEIDPYVVCEGVSIAAFNEYVGDGEGLRIPLRFLALDDGRLVIVELPTSVHESTAASFEKMFNRASGNDLEVASRRSMTARRPGNPNKEADATFGPKRTTLNRTPAPAPRTVTDWVTLAVEVGRAQSWNSLKAAAKWWCGYAGIQYVLLLKISARGTQIRYALYDSTTRPHPTIRPTASGTFRHAAAGAAIVLTFDMHRILSILPNTALPPGVSPTARVDLRIVMNLVIDSLE
ncbi:hypothetical protein GN958_ATG15401 [Phytophthora infestans]|uniref:Uncharacterized protein n=1 Tax=Phytophthora infestans TaxID=4787 RepID=A0A8S9UAX9_PHYIN|nr:hypothetical protein GN958_ATG15401 [Phytophthora infestans]